jgi:hypothetical protein
VLDIGRKTLHRKLQEYQIEDNDDINDIYSISMPGRAVQRLFRV